MRYLLSVILLFSLLSIAIGQNGKTVFNTQKTFTIIGRITHYIPNDSNGYISFRTYNIAGRSKDTAIAIGKNGQFKITLFQAFAGDIAFMYQDDFTQLYATPGEIIQLTIDDEQWKNKADTDKSIKLTGPSSEISRYMWRFSKYNQDHPVKTDPDRSENDLPETDYVSQKQLQLKEELDRLQDFTKKQHAPIAFLTWAKNDITYFSGYMTCFTLLSSKRNFSRHDSTLINYFKNIPFNSPTALHNSNYYLFMEMITGGIEITVNVNSIYEAEKRENGLNAVPIYMKLIEKYGSGNAKELMLYNLANGTVLPRLQPYTSRIESQIKDSYIRKEYLRSISAKEKPFQPEDITAKIKAQSKDSSVINRLLDVFNTYKDRYVFIDFWGSWCGPCMAEMPFYPELMTQVKDLPITFMFMAAETPQEKFDREKSKFPSEAVFINLNSNELKILNNVFNFHSYPSHFLLAPGTMTANLKMGGIKSGDKLGEHAEKKIRELVK